jgi:glucosamine kinase
MPLPDPLFLGVDGGGSHCRVRLVDGVGRVLASAAGGPSNIRLGVERSWGAIGGAIAEALAGAGLGRAALTQIHAGMGLAGIVGPEDLDAVRAAAPGFAGLAIESDAHIACLGAFGGAEGGIVIIGTGSRGYALIGGPGQSNRGQSNRGQSIGGWGLPISDLGSGADIGREAVRAAVLAYDGLGPDSPFAAALLARLGGTPAVVLSWAEAAEPRDYATLAPEIVAAGAAGDPVAVAILTEAGSRIARLVARLEALGARRICLVGGLAPALEPWLPAPARAPLAPPQGDALDGAILLARASCAAS